MLNAMIESYKDTDWKLEDLPEIGGRGLYKRVRGSQNMIDAFLCYLAAPALACADAYRPEEILKAYPDFKAMFKAAVIKEFEAQKADGRYNPGFGGLFSDGADGARKNIWNATFPVLPVATYRTQVGSPKFNAAVALGWAPFLGRYACAADVQDIMEDGRLDNPPTGVKWGHGLRYGRDLDTDFSKGEFIDQYPDRLGRYNEYGADLEALRAKDAIMKSAYFFFRRK